MSDIIQQCLGHKWAMFYNNSMPIAHLHSVQTLDQAIDTVNQQLDYNRCLSSWSAGHQDQAARLLWVNWIYQRLAHEPIRKPILTHYQNKQLHVDCGDTRLMSLRLFNEQAHTAVIATCPIDSIDHFAQWMRINNSAELKQAAGFGEHACVLARPGEHWCLDWMEIGDASTAHHLHSIDQRLHMLEHYLADQADDFKFTVDWAQSLIDWASYQATE